MSEGRTPDAEFGRIVRRFVAEAHEVAPHDLPALVFSTAQELGAPWARIWLADHQQRVLVHLPVAEQAVPVPIDGSLAGRAFITCDAVVNASEDGTHAWFPLLDGVDRIGVLEVEVGDMSSDCKERLQRFASLATSEVVTRGQYTDLFTSTRRLHQMSLSAELQWQLLPPNSFSTNDLAVAGMMEPAYEIGGDSYDYAHSDGRLEFAIFDAVGHDLRASLLSTLTVTAYRHARRSELDLVEAATAIDGAIRSQFHRVFTTGQLGDLDTSTGVVRWLNAGHPPPLRIRRGQVSTLDCRPRLPFGLADMGDARPPEIAETQLEPGDAMLLYTDGVIEAKRAGREDFGVRRLGECLHTADAAGLGPNETLRRLSNAVLEFNEGTLRDDATTLLVVWRP